MRTVIRIHIDKNGLAPLGENTVDEAALAVVVGLLRDERLIAPENNRILEVDVIRSAFQRLTESVRGPLPTDPESKPIVDIADRTYPLRPLEATLFAESEGYGDYPDVQGAHLKHRALRHSLSILAQIPPDEIEEEVTDLRELVYDRDDRVFGLLSQAGLGFTVRFRHRDRPRLRATTEKFVNAVAPRPGAELAKLISGSPSIESIGPRLSVSFDDIEMKTPAGEVAQIGHVHAVRSQFALGRHLATATPQSYLVLLSLLLLLIDLALELRLLPDGVVRDLSLRTWAAGNIARLATGAFSAYLVALFLRYATLSASLRSSSRAAGTRLARRSAYGAFIEWTTD